MATINDYKLVSQYSKKYFDYLDAKKEISDNDKKRLGFYLLALECITGNANIDEIIKSIIDTEFCNIVYREDNNDYGIDAVYIDEDENIIQLFNFKYKENFRSNVGQNERNMIDSSKFLMKLQNGQFEDVSEITRNKMEIINDKFESDEIWSTELFLVSNDNIGLKSDNTTKNDFTDAYDIKIKSITLDDIISYISGRPEEISGAFVIDTESVLTYEENSLSSSKSFLVKLPVSTLIRITCDDEESRQRTAMDEVSDLKESKLELGVLYDNVRGYLGQTKFNKNIMKTLDEEPSKFFMYNNGITITTEDIIMKPINGMKKFLCTIEGFQIVNGGQTIRTIYGYKDQNFNEENLTTAEVLVRIFKTEEDQELTNNIAEYTNSQNAISSVDLKSISNLQIQVERYLDTENIHYIRKAGDVDSKDKIYDHRITMERLGQVIYSYKGFPDRSTNQKSQLFDRYYDDIFDESEMDLELYVNLIRLYFSIEEEYRELSLDGYSQKYFYVIFLNAKYPDKENRILIKIVEEALVKYREQDSLSDARKLIQKGYRDYLEEYADNNI